MFAVLEYVGDARERIRLGEIMLKAPVPLIGVDVAVIVL